EAAKIPEGHVSTTTDQSLKPHIPVESYRNNVGTESVPSGRPTVVTGPVGLESGEQTASGTIAGKDIGAGDHGAVSLPGIAPSEEGKMSDGDRSQWLTSFGGDMPRGWQGELADAEKVLMSLKYNQDAEGYARLFVEGDEKAAEILDRLGTDRNGKLDAYIKHEADMGKKETKKETAGKGIPLLADIPITGQAFRMLHKEEEASSEEHAKRQGQVQTVVDYVKSKAEPGPMPPALEPESKPVASADKPHLPAIELYDGKVKAEEATSGRRMSGPGGVGGNGAGPGNGPVGGAIDSPFSVNGDSVIVRSGNYGGKIDLNGKDITILTKPTTTRPDASGASEHDRPEDESALAKTEYEVINLRYVHPREIEDSVNDGFRDQPGGRQRVLIEPLNETRQIILFGDKDVREEAKKMIEAIDRPRPEVRVDVSRVEVEEDVTDLPEAARFKLVPVNPWVMTKRDSLSTFALDVDTASYTMCRRYIRGGFLPPPGAVRMEEFINYFNYGYPRRSKPTFEVHAQAARSPFAGEGKNLTLLKIGVKARTLGRDQQRPAHLIIVVDASASMDQPDRLPLIQKALGLLVDKLSPVDRVSLITCANEARLHLEAVSTRQRKKIREAIDAIQPSGPTNLLAGLKLGYATARAKFDPKQINHVVLCSDGVANVGQTEADAVLKAVSEDRKQGIAITCVGVGYGAYNDAFLESLANRGDGSYVFLDSMRQARRVFVEQLAATLHTVAKDARIQVEFDPKHVRRYRL
ncbi:MAG: YfbK domain-containing protein, partial [Planctomycetota bacterium]